MDFTNEKNVIKLSSNVISSTIFFSGAEVTRSAKASILKGENKLIFEQLPENLVSESVQVLCSEDITLFSVEHKINHLQDEFNWKEYESLLLQKKDFEKEERILLSKINAIVLEEEMLLQNSILAGNETGLDCTNLKESILFVSERRSSIFIEKIELEITLENLKEKLKDIRNQLNSYENRSKIRSSLTVTVFAEQNLENITFKISYFIHDAGWYPIYDLRAVEINNNISLHYKAKVFQRTAEDWDGISLTISTSSPTQNSTCPELIPWYIDFEHPVIEASRTSHVKLESDIKERMIPDEVCVIPTMKQLDESNIIPKSVSIQEMQNMTSIDYKIQSPCNIPMNGTPQTIEVIKYELPADYQYVCVRKLDKEVFLMAEVKDWEQLELVAGEASIFFENKYVGKSFLNPRNVDEKLNISLGADKNIILTRVNGKNFSSKKLIGGTTEQTREWTLTAKNLKNKKIKLTLFDQIPVSSNKQLVVEPIDLSGGILDKDTGKITWEVELVSSESKDFFVKYSVKFPKNEIVLLE